MVRRYGRCPRQVSGLGPAATRFPEAHIYAVELILINVVIDGHLGSEYCHPLCWHLTKLLS